MKLKPNVELSSFMQSVQTCAGDVHVATAEGDAFNLKSTLSQLVFMVMLTGNGKHIDGQIHLQDSADYSILNRYLLQET